MTIMWHIRWISIPAQPSLPPEQRRFGPISENLDWQQFLQLNIVYPVIFYLVWCSLYGILNFVIAAERIKKRNYDSTYVHFNKKPGIHKLLQKFGLKFVPIIFLFAHFSFFFVCHLFAIVQFHFFYLNTFIVCMWMTLSFWNGACFYMEYFSKRYEMQLAKLQQM